ncbi:alcohol dehydrogenase GroES-like domain-containing protein [Cladorrhinum sp. PSN259]|nr:alcohol dehydrogenase GroES-like domain-containing protein [Cladorrhinum sp. PSN259]
MAAADAEHEQKKTMRAVVWEGKLFEVAVRDVPRPTIRMPEDAIVRITSTAICGSEMHTYRGYWGSNTPPWVLGHEAVGVVVEVGSATEQFKVGDRVLIPAGSNEGFYSVASTVVPSIPMYGSGPDISELDGCQAEYVRVAYADDSLVAIPDDFSSDLQWLFLSDIFPTGWAGLDFAGFQAGDSVAVFGLGPMGLMCVYAAKLRGASEIFAVDHVRMRLDKAASLGAIPIDFSEPGKSPSEQILERRPSGVMRVVDCVGYEALNQRLRLQQNYVINEAIRVASVGGGVGIPGLYTTNHTSKGAPRGGDMDPIIGVDMSTAWAKSLTLRGGIMPIYELLPRLFELVRTGRARLDFVVSAQMSIEDAARAYQRFDNKLETKVVFHFPWARESVAAGTVSPSAGLRIEGKGTGNGSIEQIAVDANCVNAHGIDGHTAARTARLSL